jgi:hypothetical protein
MLLGGSERRAFRANGVRYRSRRDARAEAEAGLVGRERGRYAPELWCLHRRSGRPVRSGLVWSLIRSDVTSARLWSSCDSAIGTRGTPLQASHASSTANPRPLSTPRAHPPDEPREFDEHTCSRPPRPPTVRALCGPGAGAVEVACAASVAGGGASARRLGR